jgi:hypothetical protein
MPGRYRRLLTIGGKGKNLRRPDKRGFFNAISYGAAGRRPRDQSTLAAEILE